MKTTEHVSAFFSTVLLLLAWTRIVSTFEKCHSSFVVDPNNTVHVQHGCQLNVGERISWAQLSHTQLGVIATLRTSTNDSENVETNIQLNNIEWAELEVPKFKFEDFTLQNVPPAASGNFEVKLNVANSTGDTIAAYFSSHHVILQDVPNHKWSGFEETTMEPDDSIRVVKSSRWVAGSDSPVSLMDSLAETSISGVNTSSNNKRQYTDSLYGSRLGNRKLKLQLIRLNRNNYRNF